MDHKINIHTEKLAAKMFILLLIFFTNLLAQSSEIPITTNSDKALVLFIDGRDKSENLQVTEAAESYDQALKEDPDFALAHIYRAAIGVGGFNVTQSHIEEAMKNIDKVSPGEKEVINYLTAQITGDQLKEKTAINNLLTSFPVNQRVQELAGTYFYFTKDFQSALSHLKQAIAIDSKYAPAYNMLGYTQAELKNYDEAEQAFKTYISLMPDKPNPYDSYAELLLKMGKYDESIEQYKMALEKDRKFTVSLIGIGNNYVFKGDFYEARNYYQRCFDRTNNINIKLSALSWIATSYVHEGKIYNAMDVLEQRRLLAKEYDLIPDQISSLNNEGFILTEAGKPEKGWERFEFALQLLEVSALPLDMKKSLMVEASLDRTYSLIANNKLSDAEEQLNKYSGTIDSRDNINEKEQYQNNLGLLELKKGDYQEALNHFQQADLSSEYTQYYMGEVYEKLGNKDKANEYYQMVKNSHANNVGLAIVRSRAAE
jgi:tetratricopeptide (TPR) repeat protein